MSAPFKLSLAIVFAAGAFVFGKFFYEGYTEITSRVDPRLEIDFSENRSEDQSPAVSSQSSPSTPSETTPSGEATASGETAPGDPSGRPANVQGQTDPESGQTRAATKPAATPGSLSKTETSPRPTQDPKTSAAEPPPDKSSSSRIGLDVAMFLGCLLGFGLLVGHGVSQYVGQKSIKTIYNDEGEGMDNPGYDEAEQAWADGHHLEAIQLMRNYLQKNPREQHVALRIAEIYEKDLKNPLAAALEYEEVLTKKLEPERWGWAAIHLCNLYYKLNQADKAFLLLKRIEAEYGQTAAAEKARKRLALIESGGEEPPTEQVSNQA